ARRSRRTVPAGPATARSPWHRHPGGRRVRRSRSMVTSFARVRHPVVSLTRPHPSRPPASAPGMGNGDHHTLAVPGRPGWPRRRGRCTLQATRTCSTKGLAMVASIKPHRDEVGLSDGLMLIDGTWSAAGDGQTWDHRHPATGEHVASFPVAGPGDVDLAVRAARRAFDEGPWPRARASERVRVLRRIADLVREHGDELLRLQALDNSV